MENLTRREFFESVLIVGAMPQVLQRDAPDIKRDFNIQIPPNPVENPNYDYNRRDLEYIVNELKGGVWQN